MCGYGNVGLDLFDLDKLKGVVLQMCEVVIGRGSVELLRLQNLLVKVSVVASSILAHPALGNSATMR